ncbi:hypothetical protein EZS27_002092 [termite gut metagenome]|uniref:Transposase IS200-like domain-containing protein n=1 Tax=termite gut metagenome TaxID=433724 RepID=A0A5J4SZ78_9ZZZZ
MPYNPIFHHRRSIRLKGYDYSQAGLYFVTICCQDKICRFGKIEKGEMVLNESGQIAYNKWVMLPERYSYVTLDVFQIMPNHIHGIIALNATAVGATLAVALNNGMNIANRATARVAPTIGNMVGAYKLSIMNKCLEIYKSQNECMGNCGNAIITNTSSVTNNHIKIFPVIYNQ